MQKKNGILVGPGRGSAAGSLVSYSLGITDLDPIKYGLLFERFLNPERISMPDIDIDFQDDGREKVIDYCKKKYGVGKIAQIITYGKLKAKAVFKDVARVFQVDFETSNKLSAMIGNSKDLAEAYKNNPEFRDNIQGNSKYKEIYENSLRLEGLNRQTGIHAAGVIIADKDIEQYVPLSNDKDGNICTQYEGDVLENSCGLIKIDFLGLKTLTILSQSIEIIKREKGVEIDINNLPLDDAKVFQMLSEGKSVGIFQFESDGMRKYLKELKPTQLDDLTAINAMYRPGPMDWIPAYISQKNKTPLELDEEKKKDYTRMLDLCKNNEKLNHILQVTHYIPIYQEQIMEIGKAIGGFTLGEADVLRRAIGKKKKDDLEKMKSKFVQKAKKLNGWNDEASFLFEKFIEPFAGYGFNKSHAVCYAMIAYQTAYLKANYPECFMSALLDSKKENVDRLKVYLEEAKYMDVSIIPPDINKSNLNFEVTKYGILYPLNAIKGVAGSAGGMIVNNRKTSPYKDFFDFFERNQDGKVNKQVIEQLVKSGCFDSFNLDAEQLLSCIPQVSQQLAEENLIKAGGQVSLFEKADENKKSKKNREEKYREIINKAEQIKSNPANLKKYEKQGLGFNIKHDPVQTHLKDLKLFCSHKALKQESWVDKDEIRMAGAISSLSKIFTKERKTAQGRTIEPREMATLQLDTGQGTVACVLFPKAFEKCQTETPDLLSVDHLIEIYGNIQKNNMGISILVDKVKNFSQESISNNLYHKVHIQFIESKINEMNLQNIEALLNDFYGQQCKIYLHFINSNREEVVIDKGESFKINLNNGFKNRLDKIDFIHKYWLE